MESLGDPVLRFLQSLAVCTLVWAISQQGNFLGGRVGFISLFFWTFTSLKVIFCAAWFWLSSLITEVSVVVVFLGKCCSLRSVGQFVGVFVGSFWNPFQGEELAMYPWLPLLASYIEGKKLTLHSSSLCFSSNVLATFWKNKRTQKEIHATIRQRIKPTPIAPRPVATRSDEG